MKEERGVFLRLVYFYKNKIKVHFSDLKGIFYNGLLVDLDEDQGTLVIDERLMGKVPILLEEIDKKTIFEFKERGERRNGAEE